MHLLFARQKFSLFMAEMSQHIQKRQIIWSVYLTQLINIILRVLHTLNEKWKSVLKLKICPNTNEVWTVLR